MSKIKRIGVLTGGGDCPGLNAVIRAVVKTGMIDYGAEAWGILDGYDGLVRNKMIELGYDSVSGILTQGGTILGTSNTAHPFKYVPPGGDPDEAEDRSDDCVKNFRDAGLVTFGFDTAVQIVAEAIDRLHTTAMSHHRVMVLETMGRYAGWLALVGGMAGGGDVILIPEIAYSLENVCEAVAERSRRGRRFSLVVVSEGVKRPDGGYVVRERVESSHDQLRLGGIGSYLAHVIQRATRLESRAVVLGHIQRGGTPTAYDRVLATRFGREAVVQAAQGNYGVMVGLQGTQIVPVPLEEIADKQRLVDPEGEIVCAARSVGTSFGD